MSKRGAWFTRLITAAGLLLGTAGLLGIGASAASAATGTGYLRLAHLSPNTPAVDVYLYSFGDPSAMVVLHHVAYGDVSPYEAVASGEYTVAMRAAGAKASSKPVLSTTIDVVSGDAYTVAGVGPFSGIRLQVLKDRLTTPANKSLARVIQASMHQATVTVTAGSRKLGSNLAFTTVTRYKTLNPGPVTVTATGPTEHGSAAFTLQPDTIYTFVVLDDSGQLKVIGLVDSSGSQAMPQGAAGTGFGGTAPRPGDGLLPWVAAAAAGLLIAAGGVMQIRRRRRPAMHAR
ncbi:MAG TPA: DUF4397 domain-containing protein [Streptosporangiaceae bacterium]|nr:DUF4397 domain-containing protein [Streptosporangiaceae bacterium]